MQFSVISGPLLAYSPDFCFDARIASDPQIECPGQNLGDSPETLTAGSGPLLPDDSPADDHHQESFVLREEPGIMSGLVRFVIAIGLVAALVSTSGCRGRQTRSARTVPSDRVTLGPASSDVPAPGPSPLHPGASSVPLQSPGYGPGPSIPLAPPAQEFGDETTFLPPPPDSSLAAPKSSYFPERRPKMSTYDFFPSEPPPSAEPQAENKPGGFKRFWNTLTSPIRRTSGRRE